MYLGSPSLSTPITAGKCDLSINSELTPDERE